MNIAMVLLILGVALVHAQGDDSSNEAVVVEAISDGDDESTDETSNEICGANEKYSECNANPLCQRTCETVGRDSIPCPRKGSQKSCIEGCVCEEDYVRTQFYGPCIHNNRCPRVKH